MPKFSVKSPSGARATDSQGRPKLKSVPAILSSHQFDDAHNGRTDSVAKVDKLSADMKRKATKARSTEENLTYFKTAFTQAAAMGQSMRDTAATSDVEPEGEGKKPKKEKETLTPREAPAPGATVLTLPFDTPTKPMGEGELSIGEFDVVLTQQQLTAALTEGEGVSQDVVEALRFFEMRYLKAQIKEMHESKLLAAGAQAADRVIFVKNGIMGRLQTLAKKQASLKEYDRLQLKLCLGVKDAHGGDVVVADTLEDTDLLYFMIFDCNSGGHFGSTFWFPELVKGIHIDSHSGCGLHELSERTLFPFLAHCHGETTESLEGRLLRKDDTSGIERQAPGSQVCGFTANKFLGLALSKLIELYRTETEDNCRTRQQALYDYLSQLTTSAKMYSKWRRQGNADLAALISDYKVHHECKRKAPAEQPLPSNKRSKMAKKFVRAKQAVGM